MLLGVKPECSSSIKTSQEEWDEDSISQLLQQADSSGDGQLQIEEFVKWIFAENIQGFKVPISMADLWYRL